VRLERAPRRAERAALVCFAIAGLLALAAWTTGEAVLLASSIVAVWFAVAVARPSLRRR
jgi:hypothetical protein